ncbi:hypothetical protein SOVF_212180, partial [Spinacia oleracea]
SYILLFLPVSLRPVKNWNL